MKKEVVQIRSPNSIRPWQHVLEPLTGYLMLPKGYSSLILFGGWNFGPNEEDIKLFLGSLNWYLNDKFIMGGYMIKTKNLFMKLNPKLDINKLNVEAGILLS